MTEERPVTRFVIAAVETDRLSRSADTASCGAARRTWVVWERNGKTARVRPTPVTAPGRRV